MNSGQFQRRYLSWPDEAGRWLWRENRRKPWRVVDAGLIYNRVIAVCVPEHDGFNPLSGQWQPGGVLAERREAVSFPKTFIHSAGDDRYKWR